MRACGCWSHNGLLTAKGLEETAQRRLALGEPVDMGGSLGYLDKVGSVSGSRRDEEFHVFHEELINEQYRRFLEPCGEVG